MEDAGKSLYEHEFGLAANKVIELINNSKFQQAFRGYDIRGVDEYLDDIISLLNHHKDWGNAGSKLNKDIFEYTKFTASFRGYSPIDVEKLILFLSSEFDKLNDIKKKYIRGTK